MAATVRKLDFTDVKDQGQFNRRRKPSGEYRAKAVAVDDHESKEGNDNYVFTIQVDGDKRASYPYYCGLQAKQLWKLRNLLVAVGLKPPTGKTKIDPARILNRPFGIILDDDEYEGRLNSVVADIFAIAEDNEFLNDDAVSTKKKKKSTVIEDDDEEEDEKPAKKSKKAVVEDDDDDDEDEEEDEEPAPVKKSKKKVVEEEDDDEPAPKKKSKKAAKKAPVEDDDDDDDDDEEEDEPPVKKAKKKSKKNRVADDDDELDTDEL